MIDAEAGTTTLTASMDGATTDAAAGTSTDTVRRRILGVVLAVALIAPPVIAIIAMVGRTWHPVDDFAIIDLRVRDVFTTHPSLTGLFSRPGWNHPGPALFWLIAPVSALFGQAAWATRVGGAVVDAAAMGWLAWITWRAGLRTMLSAAAVVGMTYLAIGAYVIRQPWNLHIPLIALPLVLFLAYLVATGSTRHLIGLAFAATVVVQTHVGFMVPVATAIVGALVCVAIDARRAGHLPDRWRSTLTITAIVLAILWLPPVVESIANWPGNLGKIAKYFAAGEYHHVGWSEATGIMAAEFRFLPPWLGGSTQLNGFTGFAVTAARAWLFVPFLALVGGGFAAWRGGRSDDRRMVGIAVALVPDRDPRHIPCRRAARVHVRVARRRRRVRRRGRRTRDHRVGVSIEGGRRGRRPARGRARALGCDRPRGPRDRRRDRAARGAAAAIAMLMPVIRATPESHRVLVRPSGPGLRSLFDAVIDELDRHGNDARVDPSLGRIFGGAPARHTRATSTRSGT